MACDAQRLERTISSLRPDAPAIAEGLAALIFEYRYAEILALFEPGPAVAGLAGAHALEEGK